MSLRVVFFGTPEFAVPSLRQLLTSTDVVGVVCQPDRPVGRGQKLAMPPIKEVALAAGVPTLQPEKLRRDEVYAQLRAWAADVMVVVAYGKILPATILDLPTLGCINVHASLLPRYRGAAPIQSAIYHGEQHTGVTIMRINEKMDAGDLLLQRVVEIGADETYGELQVRLAALGAQALADALPGIADRTLVATPQRDEDATYAPLVSKENGRIDWSQSALQLARMVRAFNPWPSAYTFVGGKRLQIHRASVGSGTAAIAGTVIAAGDTLAISTGAGVLLAHELQLEGRRRLPAADFVRSGALPIGTQLG